MTLPESVSAVVVPVDGGVSAAAATVVVCDTCDRQNRVPAAATGVPHCGNCHSALAWIVEANDRKMSWRPGGKLSASGVTRANTRRSARSINDLTASGSIRSATAVYPDRSAKSTVT